MSLRPDAWFRDLRDYRFRSIFFKYLALLAVGFILPLAASVWLVSSFGSSAMRDEILNAYRYNLIRIRDTVDSLVYESEILAIRTADHPVVQEFLSQPGRTQPDYELVDLIRRVRDLILRPPGNYIDSIYIYGETLDFVVSSGEDPSRRAGFPDDGWYDLARRKDPAVSLWYEARQVRDPGQDGKPRSFLSVFCRAPQFRGTKAGLVVVNLDCDKIRDEIVRGGSDETIFIVTPGLDLLFDSRDDLFAASYRETPLGRRAPLSYDEGTRSFRLPDLKELFVGEKFLHKDWWIFSIATLSRFQTRLGRLWQFAVLIMIGGVVLTLIVALVVSGRIYQPFKNIIGLLEHPETVPSAGGRARRRFDETGYITQNIVQSLDRSRRMEADLLDKMAALKQAQTTALQTQINPHFLYNTLHAVAFLARGLTGGDNAATEAVLALSRMLQASLDTAGSFVPLRRELEHARCYVRILELQASRVTVDWRVEEGLLDVLVPKIILQPLIENAVYHGIKPKGGDGRLTVEVEAAGERVKIRVTDDGIGMDARTLEQVRDGLKDRSIQGERIGLRNVNLRLLLMLGEEYELGVESAPAEGTSVLLYLPRIE